MVLPSDSTASPEAWKVAEHWISNCVQNHSVCSRPQANFRYPSRLLNCPLDAGIVRLVDSRVLHPSGGYLTLSHRWGSANFLKLQRGNIKRLQEGFLIHELPQAFQDAVSICKRLGISYIWIDSLCIIQDDADDWARESALMGQVYSHGFLNLSAIGAKDSSYSFFAHRHATSVQPPMMKALRDWTEPASGLRDYVVYDSQMLHKELEGSELNLRAWVLQERLLARRVLHFGAKRLFWECHCELAAEQWPSAILQTMSASIRAKSLDLNTFAEARQRRTGNDAFRVGGVARSLWNNVVESYSKCQLTKPLDKLVAISGIAKHVATLLDDEYVVGMWRGHLAHELLWYRDEATQDSSRLASKPSIYRAPSWSWPSVDGAICTAGYNGDLLFKVLDHRLEFASEDVTGQLTGGSLTLFGHLKKATVMLHSDEEPPHMRLCDLEPSEDTEGSCIWEWPLPLHLDEIGEIVDLKDREDLYCMLGRAYDDPYAEEGTTWKSIELLLLSLVDGESSTYERLGVMISYEDELVQMVAKRNDHPLSTITLI